MLWTLLPKGRKPQKDLWTLSPLGRKPQTDLRTSSPEGQSRQMAANAVSPIVHPLLRRGDASRLYRMAPPVSR
ncbi:MAG: hypothetical protein LBR08_03990 [Bacteroidales bacterium]|nr:hypothetical protein [Bacteroidales bacterium]